MEKKESPALSAADLGYKNSKMAKQKKVKKVSLSILKTARDKKEEQSFFYLKHAYDNKLKSEGEYDKMIVYMSGGAIVLSVGFIKDLVNVDESVGLWCLFCSWAFFVLALLVSLYSHKVSADAWDEEVAYWHCELNNKKHSESEKSKLYVWLTGNCNKLALLLLFSGVVSLIVFVSINIH
ncbi:MAG: hypothetical protein MI784_09765 [Cytophagales bacterium]|nr:hypothetical protein [Cytophagales bacterium]